MNKHVPGPWEYTGYKVISRAELRPNRASGYGCNNAFVADLNDGEYHEYHDQEEQDATGRLIAAAPDLLAACENALQLLDPWEWPALYMQLKNVVTKAKGLTDEPL